MAAFKLILMLAAAATLVTGRPETEKLEAMESAKAETLDTSNTFNLISTPRHSYHGQASSGPHHYANSYSYAKYLVPSYQYNYVYPGQPYYDGFYNQNYYQYQPTTFGFLNYKQPFSSGPYHQRPLLANLFNYRQPQYSHSPLNFLSGSPSPLLPGGPPVAGVSGSYQQPFAPTTHADQTVYNLPVLNARVNRLYH